MTRALITGGSAGLGRALRVRPDARPAGTSSSPDATRERLAAAAAELGPRVTAVAGDVTDPGHRDRLAERRRRRPRPARQQRQHPRHQPAGPGAGADQCRAAPRLGDERGRSGGPDPDTATDAPRRVPPSSTSPPMRPPSTTRPGARTRRARPRSSTSRSPWPPRIPSVRWYAVDPGDLRTQMHQDAFPGEDISDRPLPETVVAGRSSRYRPAPAERSLPRGGAGGGDGGMTTPLGISPLITFTPPGERTAPSPAESRGIARDEVRLLVADGDRVRHTHFRDLADHLDPGDLIVVNTSQTVAGEADARLSEAGRHATSSCTWRWTCATAPGSSRSAPLRMPSRAVLDADPGQVLTLTGVDGAAATLLDPYPRTGSSPTGEGNRLWRAVYAGDEALRDVLDRVGRPIAYGYLDQRYALADYQTIFGTTPGSAEMPSASRPFTPEVVTRLVSRGVGIAPVLLHTGVSSQEAGEAPQPEWFEVGESTARLVNSTRAGGRPHHRGRHDRDPRPGVGRRGRIRAARGQQRLDRARRHPRAPGRGSSTASSPAGTIRRRPTCCSWSRSPGRSWPRRPTTPPWPAGTGGTSSATPRCSCRRGPRPRLPDLLGRLARRPADRSVPRCLRDASRTPSGC